MNADMLKFLACPENGAALEAYQDILTSEQGTAYPMRFGVPILVPGVEVKRHDRDISELFLDDMVAISHDGADLVNRVDLAEAFRCEVNFADFWLNSEASMFVNRLNGQADRVRAPYDIAQVPALTHKTPSRSGKVKIEPLVMPKEVHAGWGVTINMCIHNDTDQVLHATGPNAVSLVFSITAKPEVESKFSRFLPFKSFKVERQKNTELLIDLAPGRSITQPVRLDMPVTHGAVDCAFTVEQHGKVLARAEAPITLVGGDDPLDPGWGYSGVERDYNADHLHAFEVMKEWLDTYAKGEASVLVELGGNFSPMTHIWPGPRFNMDIDAHGMFSHSLLHASGVANPDMFMDIIGDGMRPPFCDGVLDAVVMYATFHHFPDPVGLLRGFLPKLAPGGIVMLFCEPVGHVFADTGATEYIHELELGAFEQSFMYWEYAALADAAGYDVIATANDLGSAKIALRPKI